MNKIHSADWHEMLDPPVGGLARLIDAVEIAHASRSRWRPAVALVGASAAIVFCAVFGFAWQVHHNSPEYRFRHALEAALRPAAPAQGIQVENGAALEISSTDPNVRIYWIAQLPGAASKPREY
ncbi:MAG: hypothetical protein JSR65_10395 [Proteobacteria bacterium]|nr:hypothetical protein [Pseudomonadota bacterium]